MPQVTYFPQDPLSKVKGIGPSLAAILTDQNLTTVQDLLLTLPLRYEDRSNICTIAAAPLNQPITILATVKKVSQFYKPGRSITQATIEDDTGKLNCYWFNSPYIRTKLKIGQEFCFAGKVTLNTKTSRPVLSQPVVEALSTDADTIHTGRIVPLYTQTLAVKQGSLRRVLKEIVDHLAPWQNFQINQKFTLAETLEPITEIISSDLAQAFKTLHFPDSTEAVILARERLALEELLSVIHQATQLKNQWQHQSVVARIKPEIKLTDPTIIPTSIPFTLTTDQRQAVTEILTDLNLDHPMNRLLMGDVGSGKTVVAGIAAEWTIKAGQNACLVAPTQILAEQHLQTLQKILPNLPIVLLTSTTRAKLKIDSLKPQLYLGTHAVLNQLHLIKPALLIYDEQHRFGVKHRSPGWEKLPAVQQAQPHLLTMTATPIPRSLMLSLFAHLKVSTLTQSAFNKIPTQTWLVPESKRVEALAWVKRQLTPDAAPQSTSLSVTKSEQGLVVCPFINPSETAGFETIAAATETFTAIKAAYDDPNFQMALLHGGQSTAVKKQVMADLFAQKIQLLVTTPIVEVGVDLPAAKLMIIEAAERFGLASLHQLRGRVGRAGQASYCLLFTQSHSPEVRARLQAFCHEHDGLKLAELDLQRRGAGDLFGTAQHGFGELQFASWTNLSLIQTARLLYQNLIAKTLKWQPLFSRKQATALPVAAN